MNRARQLGLGDWEQLEAEGMGLRKWSSEETVGAWRRLVDLSQGRCVSVDGKGKI